MSRYNTVNALTSSTTQSGHVQSFVMTDRFIITVLAERESFGHINGLPEGIKQRWGVPTRHICMCACMCACMRMCEGANQASNNQHQLVRKGNFWRELLYYDDKRLSFLLLPPIKTHTHTRTHTHTHTHARTHTHTCAQSDLHATIQQLSSV